ncbi:hypothetical protein [Fimbriimonas ginsengisoli]|uniref:Uncharacterized protein n=1 Tax=Fimbriimonas ginsengisoli Gsoil 348 TaxID=661478 RepID=A0A068NW66_FIMGI|nr:hypothetical protein [Fimbriimonas ginsengisoli]AIE87577.1 hypothetical protein OP10G_4209 [Fimbriimonas ginsengisoli Gsoil 348]
MTSEETVARPLSERELFFATNHQAAHAVVAMTLGCFVGDLAVSDEADTDPGWSSSPAPLADAESIFAAGYAMEMLLWRTRGRAWAESECDRQRLADRYGDVTGNDLSPEAADARFLDAAAQSRAILNHDGARRTIDALAHALVECYSRGSGRLEAAAVRAITTQFFGDQRPVAAISVAD